MDFIVDNNTLTFLWSALNQKGRHPKLFQAEKVFQKLAKKGWVYSSDIEDILNLLDSRLDSYQFNIENFANAIGLKWETVYHRPKANSISVCGSKAIRIEDSAFFLFTLERIGFQVDASCLVKILLPTIKSRNKTHFTDAELEIFWFAKTRHKYEGFSLKLEGGPVWGETIGSIKTALGYKIELKADEKGVPSLINIHSPKFRKKKEPTLTICPNCGAKWYKGDPDSSAGHRREHKRRMNWLNPQPLPDFIEERTVNQNAEIVTFSSPKWKHFEMYERALAFKRELGFDFIQWLHPDSAPGLDVFGYLFGNNDCAIVGACSFRQRTAKSERKYWGLEWIWICPKERKKGHLTARWKMFRERFGDFVVESPVSDDMKSFLTKKGELNLLNYPE